MIGFVRGTAVIAAIAASATTAAAGSVALTLDYHLTGATFNCPAAVDESTIGCTDIVPNGPFAAAANHLFVLLGGAVNGAAAVQFGIEFETTGETDIWQTWATCSGFLQIPTPEWPLSGSGNAIAFGQCVMPVNDAGIIAIGYFFATSPLTTGQQTFIPDNGNLIISDCSDISRPILQENTGVFDFEGLAGEVACGALPTEERSWGQIKALF